MIKNNTVIKLDEIDRPVLFVVDMINGFCKKGAMADKDIMNIVPSISKLCSKLEPLSRWFIRDAHKLNDIEFESFPVHCLDERWESEVIDELQKYIIPDESNTIKKNSTNAFHSIHFKEILCKSEFNQSFIITGCCTDICVMQLALTLKTYLNSINMNKRVIVPIDCVETYHVDNVHEREEMNEVTFKVMNAAGIEIVGKIV